MAPNPGMCRYMLIDHEHQLDKINNKGTEKVPYPGSFLPILKRTIFLEYPL